MAAGSDDARAPRRDPRSQAKAAEPTGAEGTPSEPVLTTRTRRTLQAHAACAGNRSGRAAVAPAVRLPTAPAARTTPEQGGAREMRTSTGRRMSRAAWLAGTVVVVTLLAAACSTSNGGTGGGGSRAEGRRVGLLRPGWKTTRYEDQDRPLCEG